MCFNNYNCKKKKKKIRKSTTLFPLRLLLHCRTGTSQQTFSVLPLIRLPLSAFHLLLYTLLNPRLFAFTARVFAYCCSQCACECVCSHWDYHHRGWYNLLVETQWTLQPVPTFIRLLKCAKAHTYMLWCILYAHTRAGTQYSPLP